MVCFFLLFELTLGRRISEFESKIEKLNNKQERIKVLQKVKEEISKANKKENILTDSEKKLFSDFINVFKKLIKSDLSSGLT